MKLVSKIRRITEKLFADAIEQVENRLLSGENFFLKCSLKIIDLTYDPINEKRKVVERKKNKTLSKS